MPSSSNTRILKNTLYLYLRMFFVMAVSLYTSRVVLDVLGIEDYGLYNVIAGFVVLFSILNNSMEVATQRFLTFEIGKGNPKKVDDTFCMSLTAHFGIAIVLLILCETVGLWYIHNHLVIPEGREHAAYVVYQISLLILMITIIRTPYNSLIIAHERMSFFAIVSILGTVLKLLIVYALCVFAVDKLILYASLLCAVEFLMLVFYWRYCKKNYQTSYRFFIDPPYFKKLLSFLGWNVMGGFATLGTQQAGNLIVNSFFGVAVNAAFGVAYQVNGALNQFVNNFQTAFRPQIVKLFSQEKYEDLYLLINRAALLSYYLIFIVSFPIFVNMDQVLGFWLKEVPEYSAGLCQLLILNGYIDALQAPLWMGITATGNIRAYQIWTSVLFILNIPLSILFISWGFSPYWILIIRLMLVVVMAIYRTIHAKRLYALPLSRYFTVIGRVVLSTSCVCLIWYMFKPFFTTDSLLGFIYIYALLVVISTIIAFTLGISKQDRGVVVNLVKSKLLKFKDSRHE